MAGQTDTYAALTATPRVEDLRDRHLAYYAELAERGDAALYGPDVAAWHRLLDSEYDNFIQALERAVATGQAASAHALATVVYWVCGWRGDTAPAGPWLEKALDVDAAATGLRAQVQLCLADVVLGDYNDRERAFRIAQEALAVAQEAGEKRFEAWALRRIGSVFVGEVGGVAAATALLEQSLEAARATGSEHEEAHSLSTLARRNAREDPEGCRRAFEKSLDIFRRVGDTWNAAWIIYGMAWGEPDPIKAQQLAAETEQMARSLDDSTLLICARDMMGWLAVGRGEHDAAHEIFAATLDEFRQPGRKWPLWWAVSWQLQSLAEIEVNKGQLETARAREEEALQLATAHDAPRAIRAARSHLARITAFEGDVAGGLAQAADAVALARQLGEPAMLGNALRFLADVCLLGHDLAGATAAWEEAKAIYTSELGIWPLVSALQGLGAVAIADGRLGDARAHLEEALELAKRSPSVAGREIGELALARVARLQGAFDEADRLSAGATSALAAKRHRPRLAQALEERAALAMDQGDAARAAKIFGAASALREQIGIPVSPLERADFDAEVAKVTAALGDTAFNESFEEGRGLDLEEAATLAV